MGTQAEAAPTTAAKGIAVVRAVGNLGRSEARAVERQVLDALVAEGGEPSAIVEREGLAAMDGGDELAGIVAAAIAANEGAAQKVRGGNDKAMGPIVGFVMRETKGRADGGEVGRLIREQLGV